MFAKLREKAMVFSPLFSLVFNIKKLEELEDEEISMFSPCSEEIYGDIYTFLKEKLSKSGLMQDFTKNQVDSSLLSLIYRCQYPVRLSLITSPSSSLLCLLQSFGQKYYSLVRFLFNGPEEIVEFIVSRVNRSVEMPVGIPQNVRELSIEERRMYMLVHLFGENPQFKNMSDNTLLLCIVLRYMCNYNVLADIDNSNLLIQCFIASMLLKDSLPLR